MTIILDTNNVFEYLSGLNYCNLADRDTSQVTITHGKNFNLLISFADGKNLLVKQEIYNQRGETKGEFWTAWRMNEFVEQFPAFGAEIGKFLPELLYFDRENSILVVRYLADYGDLSDYYRKEHQFPIDIARSIGQLLANIHSRTFQQSDHYEFFQQDHPSSLRINSAIDIIDRLDFIPPKVYQMMPLECLQFFKLYQRFPSLSQAIDELANSIEPSCLIHNDLKLNNILLDLSWEQPTSQVIRLIDWERVTWGDPAFDLGCILASYLKIWLDSLIVSNSLTINDSLQLAGTPLELLQPSLFNLVDAYLDKFPEILIARPDYLDRSIQFTGLALIEKIEIIINQDRIFGNRGIVMLQVAKQLICSPQAAMSTLFGSNHTKLLAK
jgi:serine/threonine protein kinase